MAKQGIGRVTAATSASRLSHSGVTPLDLINIVRPNVLIKGADYNGKEIAGSDVVENTGGQIVLIELEAGYSTTNLVNRLRDLGSKYG